MTIHRELAGSVKPYFARSIPRDTALAEGAMLLSGPLRVETIDDVLPGVVPQEIVRDAVSAAGWMISEEDGACAVVVPTGMDRTQTVSVEIEHFDEVGRPLVVYSSYCGPATNKNAMALMRRNARLYQTAFAIEKRDEVELFVLRGFQLLDGLDAANVVRIINAVARHADSIERKLTGTDEY